MGRKDVQISKFTIVASKPQPRNTAFNHTIENIEDKLIELEVLERGRTIDIKGESLCLSNVNC
jgi:hypothetical protein